MAKSSKVVIDNSLYNYYATATDVKVFLTHVGNNKIMHLDKALGVGYSTDINSVPIYTIGSSTPAFFSKGNFLGQGVLVLPFVDERYLKTSLQYLFDELPSSATNTDSLVNADPNKFSDNAFRQAKLLTSTLHSDTLNLVTINSEFNIVISIDTSNAFRETTTRSITLKGVKLVSDSFEVNSQHDGILQIGYKFYFKDIGR